MLLEQVSTQDREILHVCIGALQPNSSRSSTGEVNALKEEVTTLKSQLVGQGEHIRAQDERMSMIVHTLAMSGLQILMPAPNLAPPSTSQPLHPADTQ